MPDIDSSGVHLWLILWKTFESVRAHAVRHVCTLGLGFSDFAVLELLLHKGPTPVNAIGQRVYLTSG
jgi:MarR family 2-MHQ and catechol resistance regulon transcriptional repressor